MAAVTREDDYIPNISGIINCLRQAQCYNLKLTLECSWRQIGMMRQMGYKKQVLLFELLRRIAENPDSISNYKGARAVKPSPRKKLINRVIRRNMNDQETQALIAKEKKLHEIKERLRQMGLVT